MMELVQRIKEALNLVNRISSQHKSGVGYRNGPKVHAEKSITDISDIGSKQNNDLGEAVRNSDFEEVKRLIESGMSPNENLEGSLTPLAIAITKNDSKMVQFLLENGAAPESPTIWHPTPEQNDRFYTEHFKMSTTQLENLKDRMFKMGFDLNQPILWNDPVLNLAVKKENLFITNLLLKAGASPKKVLKNIFTTEPLFEAVKIKSIPLASTLLEHGSDPDAPLDNNIMKAVFNGDDRMIRLLIDKGANTYYREDSGLNPVLVAISNYDEKCLDIILKKCREDLVKLQNKVLQRKAEIARMEALPSSAEKQNRKLLKRAYVDLYTLEDRLEQYKDILTYSAAVALSERKGSDKIMKVVAARENFDLNKLSKEDYKEILRREMDHLYDKFYFSMPARKPWENMEYEREDYVLDPVKRQRGQRLNPVQVLKKHTFLQSPHKDRERVSTLMDKLLTYDDPYISTILTCAALDAIRTTTMRGPTRIFVAKATSGSVTPLVYTANPKGVVLGLTDLELNKVFFSRILRESDASRILVHELTHAACKIYKDAVSKEEYREGYQYLAESIRRLTDKMDELEKSNPELFETSGATSPERFIKNCIGRVKKASSAYFFEAYANEDIFCDIMAGRQYMNRHPERSERMEKLVAPVLRFADEVLMPKLLQTILEHPERKELILPNSVEQSIQRMKGIEVGVAAKRRSMERIL